MILWKELPPTIAQQYGSWKAPSPNYMMGGTDFAPGFSPNTQATMFDVIKQHESMKTQQPVKPVMSREPMRMPTKADRMAHDILGANPIKRMEIPSQPKTETTASLPRSTRENIERMTPQPNDNPMTQEGRLPIHAIPRIERMKAGEDAQDPMQARLPQTHMTEISRIEPRSSQGHIVQRGMLPTTHGPESMARLTPQGAQPESTQGRLSQVQPSDMIQKVPLKEAPNQKTAATMSPQSDRQIPDRMTPKEVEPTQTTGRFSPGENISQIDILAPTATTSSEVSARLSQQEEVPHMSVIEPRGSSEPIRAQVPRRESQTTVDRLAIQSPAQSHSEAGSIPPVTKGQNIAVIDLPSAPPAISAPVSLPRQGTPTPAEKMPIGSSQTEQAVSHVPDRSNPKQVDTAPIPPQHTDSVEAAVNPAIMMAPMPQLQIAQRSVDRITRGSLKKKKPGENGEDDDK